jgi:hypothetical protein
MSHSTGVAGGTIVTNPGVERSSAQREPTRMRTSRAPPV